MNVEQYCESLLTRLSATYKWKDHGSLGLEVMSLVGVIPLLLFPWFLLVLVWNYPVCLLHTEHHLFKHLTSSVPPNCRQRVKNASHYVYKSWRAIDSHRNNEKPKEQQEERVIVDVNAAVQHIWCLISAQTALTLLHQAMSTASVSSPL